MWGLQMVGADICGFGGNTTEELCSRWIQLGSLYPFARDHNDHSSQSQELYALGPIVMKAAQENLRVRYSLLKHYFSLFLNRRGIGSIFSPIFFIFPLDATSYLDEISDTHIMIGNNLLATPIL
jgi:alpha-glucosidase (family GH31 glycosyl hydrolase)